MKRRLWLWRMAVVVAVSVAFPLAARAQQPPPSESAPPPAAPPPAPAPPPPAPAGGVSPAQSLTPPLATESMPATREEKLPPISVGAWLRTSGRIQGTNPKNLDGVGMDSAYAELHAGGKIHKNVSVTLNLNGGAINNNGLPDRAVGVEDAIIGFDFADEFHLWVGQLLVPVDRPNYGGPFFAIPWNYPGFLSVGGTTFVTAPVEGAYGRNTGGSIWGDVAGGKFMYKVGAFQSGPLSQSPLFSGRLTLDLVGTEGGYFGNATYFGDKDIVALGVGGQFQKDGSVVPVPMGAPVGTMASVENYGEVNADALVELKYGGGGWFTVDGGYYHFTAQNNPAAAKDAFYLLGAIATPKLGFGNIQPMVRYQFGAPVGGAVPKAWSLDVFVSYLIMGPALRATLGVQHTELGSDARGNDRIGNALQLGAQAIFF